MQVGPPHVAAVNDTERKPGFRRHRFEHRPDVGGSPHQIEMQAVDRKPSDRRKVFRQRAEIDGEKQLRGEASGQGAVGKCNRQPGFFGQVERQHRLIHLHPRATGLQQLPEYFA